MTRKKAANALATTRRATPTKRASGDVESKGVTFIPTTAAINFPFGPTYPGSSVNYAGEVNNGMQSSVVTSALCWMMRTFPEAPLVVQKSVDERYESIAQHELTKLVRRPNAEYGGRVLWMATIMDFCFGEAFWLKIRNGEGNVVELVWIPRTMITPQPDPKPGALDHYAYNPGVGAIQKLSPTTSCISVSAKIQRTCCAASLRSLR
jgi:phage portal protein BeeE